MGFAFPSNKTSGFSFVRNIFSSHFHEILNSQLKIPQQKYKYAVLRTPQHLAKIKYKSVLFLACKQYELFQHVKQQYSVHRSCTLGFRGTRVSYQFNIRHYVCRNVPLVHLCTSILLIPGYCKDFHRHVTPISRDQIFLTHPHRGTKFPNPHNFILVTFLVVAITILPPHHHSNRHN